MKLEKEEIVPALVELFEGYKQSLTNEVKEEMGSNSFYDCDWDRRDKLVDDKVSFTGFIKWINRITNQ